MPWDSVSFFWNLEAKPNSPPKLCAPESILTPFSIGVPWSPVLPFFFHSMLDLADAIKTVNCWDNPDLVSNCSLLVALAFSEEIPHTSQHAQEQSWHTQASWTQILCHHGTSMIRSLSSAEFIIWGYPKQCSVKWHSQPA